MPKYQVQMFRTVEDLHYGLNEMYEHGYEVLHFLENYMVGHRMVGVVFQRREEVIVT